MRRIRITITLTGDTLKKVDRLIDHKKIRNRSHAIEYAISQYTQSQIKKAIILTGGQGTSMRPYTYEMPKSLLPVKGKPILEHLINGLKKTGITEIILCTGYLGEKIKEHFGNGEKYGVQLIYSHEQKPLLTGGSILKVKPLVDNEPFLVIHGDILTNFSFGDLIDFHKQTDSLATAALTSVNQPTGLGQLKLHGTKLVRFYQTSEKDDVKSHLVNTGMYACEPGIFAHFPRGKQAFLFEDVIEKLITENLVSGFVFEDQWFDVGNPESYEAAIKAFKEK